MIYEQNTQILIAFISDGGLQFFVVQGYMNMLSIDNITSLHLLIIGT